MIQSQKLAVKLIVTCLNEEGNVQEFIDELMENLSSEIDLALLLIDNGSSDNTGQVITKLAQKYSSITPIYRETTLEYGKSILEALKFKIDFFPEYIGWAPSDNQISGKDVNETINILVSRKIDFIKAERFEKNYSLWRRVQSFVFNAIVSVLFLKRIKDINGSPKFFRTNLLAQLELTSEGWFLDGEAFLKSLKLVSKEKIGSISLRFNERTHGRSNTSWITAFELLIKVVIFRFWGIRKWAKNLKSG
ncbi:MAG: glycosyltransferase family 2 protein [Candidatus Hodarchaeales archaeon]|jgi:glycosyltransferase involved in cell wall biosynthesis